MQRLGHNRALDGLRGIAILGVIFRHAFPTSLNGGGQGVEIFFVLSGFLITTLLLEEREETTKISLRAFYRRRSWRLLPALGVLLAVVIVVEAIRGHAGEGIRGVAVNGFYTANIRAVWFPNAGAGPPLGPLWSLSQEEQFYMVWPAVLLLLLSVRLSERKVMAILAGAIGASLVEAFVVTLRDGWWTPRTFGPDTHCGGLLLGALLAIALRRPSAERAWRFRPTVDWIGLLLLVILYCFEFPFGVVAPVTYAMSACLVVVAVCQPTATVTRVACLRPIVWFGRISYSLYLWHIFFLWLLNWHHRGIAIGIAVTAAYISTRWFEEPLRRRHRSKARRAPLLAPEAAAA